MEVEVAVAAVAVVVAVAVAAAALRVDTSDRDRDPKSVIRRRPNTAARAVTPLPQKINPNHRPINPAVAVAVVVVVVAVAVVRNRQNPMIATAHPKQ